jgi:hypothetical protein
MRQIACDPQLSEAWLLDATQNQVESPLSVFFGSSEDTSKCHESRPRGALLTWHRTKHYAMRRGAALWMLFHGSIVRRTQKTVLIGCSSLRSSTRCCTTRCDDSHSMALPRTLVTRAWRRATRVTQERPLASVVRAEDDTAGDPTAWLSTGVSWTRSCDDQSCKSLRLGRAFVI